MSAAMKVCLVQLHCDVVLSVEETSAANIFFFNKIAIQGTPQMAVDKGPRL